MIVHPKPSSLGATNLPYLIARRALLTSPSIPSLTPKHIFDESYLIFPPTPLLVPSQRHPWRAPTISFSFPFSLYLESHVGWEISFSFPKVHYFWGYCLASVDMDGIKDYIFKVDGVVSFISQPLFLLLVVVKKSTTIMST